MEIVEKIAMITHNKDHFKIFLSRSEQCNKKDNKLNLMNYTANMLIVLYYKVSNQVNSESDKF
jgi:hypothetical protein